MLIFWVSVVLSILCSGYALLNTEAGIGTQFVAIIFAVNAHARLHRGKPARSPFNAGVTRLTLVLSLAGAAIGLYRLM